MEMRKKIKPIDLAMTLGISPEDLMSYYKEDRDAQGLRRSYLEGVSRRMAGAERWGSYIDVVALIMFGIVLFPKVSDFVDVAAISIFWTVKNLEIDLVSMLLTDVYYTMSICHNREKGSLRYYIPLLYQWKVTRAWEKVHVKDNKPKRKGISSEESYTPWIKGRICLVKLPFIIDPAYVPDMPNPITMSTEEVGRLKLQNKESLEHNLYDAAYEKNQISYNLELKDKYLLENMEELHTERSKRRKTLGGLFSVGVNFENLNGKLKEAQAEGPMWKRA
ncbi:hypothetical protein KIW84_058255 [Lathyrus oleraceus]|uniref:DUF7745 domain-containing protein n=1 Tax=Pisum sativum TaxID=3888 RepID=A0A9D4X3D3_PEA|nr:hypothetical protein KIW84_058255 [Pisum sativum]